MAQVSLHHPLRYGIKGPVYFKNKSGAVAMPSATGEDRVTFGPGNHTQDWIKS